MSKHKPELRHQPARHARNDGKSGRRLGSRPAGASGRDLSGAATATAAPVNGVAGVDRVVVLPGKTYLRAWAGYGEPPRPSPRRGAAADSTPPAPAGPPPTVRWSKKSGPGRVTFADPAALITSATLSEPGVYVLELLARDSSGATASSTLKVKVETPPPAKQLDVVHMRKWSIDSTLWNHRMKALIVSWIPHCIEQLERTDIAAGGLDNFIEAGQEAARRAARPAQRICVL